MAEQTDCVHHWKIDAPAGPTSRGVCKICGAERRFPNSEPEVVPIWRKSKAG